MTELDTLLPVLDALAPADVVEPNTPMAVALQEAHDLHSTIQADDTWEHLLLVGAPLDAREALAQAVAATRQAQSQWVVVRDRGKPQAQRDREQAGTELRSELVAACRWNLRDDPRALAVVDEIVQGEGIPDLIQDLLDLSALIHRHLPAFARDGTFDAAAQAEAARSSAAAITAGLSESRTQSDHDAALQRRNRAYSHMTRLVAVVREAGRYAFRKDPQRAAAFGSAYLRKLKARSRRKTSARAGKAVASSTDA